MKLLHVIRSIDPRGGGPQEGLRQIVLELERHGWESEVVTAAPPGANDYVKVVRCRRHSRISVCAARLREIVAAGIARRDRPALAA